MITAQQIYYKTGFFSLSIKQNKTTTHIIMNLYTLTVNTKDLPATYPTLKEILPTILHSQCFNEEKLPFSTEVRHTELGHLFEHIMLEYLCLLKVASGGHHATYTGVTKWNWKKDPWGTFHIYINIGFSNAPIFSDALGKSVTLFNTIIIPYEKPFLQNPPIISPITEAFVSPNPLLKSH